MRSEMFGCGVRAEIKILRALNTMDKSAAQQRCQIRVLSVGLLARPQPWIAKMLMFGDQMVNPA